MLSIFIHILACIRTSLFFHCQIILCCCMDIVHFVYHPSIDGNLGCFHLLAIINNVAMNIYTQIFEWPYVFISLGYIPSSRIAGLAGNSMFNILRNCQAVLQGDFAILQSHQECMRVPISPHSCQHLLLSVLFILAILMGVKWYLIVVLIYISLMTNEVGHLFM